jgi:predicted ArsR family transcriptional regulator
MVEGTIKTGVDNLIELLKNTDKITLNDAAKKLKIKTKILQKWVDFLVEEKIISVEYKFTVPYIYLNRTRQEEKNIVSKKSLEEMKTAFTEKAERKNIPEEHISALWGKKLEREIENQKEYFFRYARLKKIADIEKAWAEYCIKVKGIVKKTN